MLWDEDHKQNPIHLLCVEVQIKPKLYRKKKWVGEIQFYCNLVEHFKMFFFPLNKKQQIMSSINTVVVSLSQSHHERMVARGSVCFFGFFLSAHHWSWLEFEVRGREHKQALACTANLSCAPHASGDKMFVSTAAAASVCTSISLLPPTIFDCLPVSYESALWQPTVLVCLFSSSGFYSPGPPSGPPCYGAKASGTV